MATEIKDWEPTGDIAPLKDILGKTVDLYKIGSKDGSKFELYGKPVHKLYGYLRLVDRGGGPSTYISSLSEWHVSSWVLKAEKTEEGYQFETENSLYLLKIDE